MSILDFDNNNNSGNFWNYHSPDKSNYTLELTGDIVAISTPQATNFATKQPEFWPNGEPKLLICLHIGLVNGQEVCWSFSPGSKKSGGSAALKAVRSALAAINAPAKSVSEIGGKNVTISTQAGVYSAGYPRPWNVRINGQATLPYRGVDESQPDRMKPQGVPQAAFAAARGQLPQQQQQQHTQPQAMPSNQVPYTDQDIPF